LLNAPPGGTDRHQKKHRRGLRDRQQGRTGFAAHPRLIQLRRDWIDFLHTHDSNDAAVLKPLAESRRATQ